MRFETKASAGRASRPGLRWLLVGIGLLVAGASLGSWGPWRTSSATATSSTSNDNTYGGLPSWLPRSKVPVNRIVDASVGHPQLGIGGSSFEVSLRGGSTLATMSGPETPPFATPPPPVTRATFVITFARTTGAVVVRAEDFGVIDGNGDVFYPKSFVGGAKQVVASTSRALTVKVSEVTATGTGSIAWAPDGRHPVVTWEYTLEND
jgi:hypothetical protein